MVGTESWNRNLAQRGYCLSDLLSRVASGNCLVEMRREGRWRATLTSSQIREISGKTMKPFQDFALLV